jgi:hypothetical protein
MVVDAGMRVRKVEDAVELGQRVIVTTLLLLLLLLLLAGKGLGEGEKRAVERGWGVEPLTPQFDLETL